MSFIKYLLPGWKNLLTDKSSANAGILAAIDTEFQDTETDVMNSKGELSLDTAEGKWLDNYGNLIGVIRKDSETDSPYRTRIINFIQTDRGTVPSITAAVQNYLGDNTISVEVYEPYKNIFFLNSSHLNGTDSFHGKYYTTAVINIKIGGVVPSGLADYLNDYAPAGVTIVLSSTVSVIKDGGSFVTASYDTIEDGGQFQGSSYVTTLDGGGW